MNPTQLTYNTYTQKIEMEFKPEYVIPMTTQNIMKTFSDKQHKSLLIKYLEHVLLVLVYIMPSF